MKNRLKCTKDCLIVFWLSIFAMFLISAIEGRTSPPELIPQNSIIITQSGQDTIPQDTIKKVSEKKLSDKEMKKLLEYREFQKSQRQMDEDMNRMKQQSIIMDSLINTIDTTKVVR